MMQIRSDPDPTFLPTALVNILTCVQYSSTESEIVRRIPYFRASLSYSTAAVNLGISVFLLLNYVSLRSLMRFFFLRQFHIKQYRYSIVNPRLCYYFIRHLVFCSNKIILLPFAGVPEALPVALAP
jgi:hypothetical protein